MPYLCKLLLQLNEILFAVGEDNLFFVALLFISWGYYIFNINILFVKL